MLGAIIGVQRPAPGLFPPPAPLADPGGAPVRQRICQRLRLQPPVRLQRLPPDLLSGHQPGGGGGAADGAAPALPAGGGEPHGLRQGRQCGQPPVLDLRIGPLSVRPGRCRAVSPGTPSRPHSPGRPGRSAAGNSPQGRRRAVLRGGHRGHGHQAGPGLGGQAG